MARKKIQWHPLFTRLLRPQVERYYEIRTEVPVGDLPRRAYVVLLRRVSVGPLPFRGLWRYLTPWNVLDFKGRTETARPMHLLRVRAMNYWTVSVLNEFAEYAE